MDEQNNVDDIGIAGGGATADRNPEQENIQSVQQSYQQMPQYGQAPQMNWQIPQYGQAPQMNQQMPQYGQPYQQYGGQYQNMPMGYAGYEYRQNMPVEAQKGSTHIPNLLNIIGIIMAVIAVFLPYAYIDSDVRSISSVFEINVLIVFIAAILLIGDIVCAFVDRPVCYIIDFVISLVSGGALIVEFILAIIDLGQVDKSIEAGLKIGSWFSVAAAAVVLVSVPIWWTISRKKNKTENVTSEAAS